MIKSSILPRIRSPIIAPFNLWTFSGSRWYSAKKVPDQPTIADQSAGEEPPKVAKPTTPDPLFVQKQRLAQQREYKNLPEYQKTRIAIKKRYGEWNPTRKISREQMENVRSLKEQMPQMKNIELAGHFGISPEAIRRILKSKWVPTQERMDQMERRGETKKDESNQKKLALANEITLARKRMTYGKSIDLGKVAIVSPTDARSNRRNVVDSKATSQRNLSRTIETFTKNGKVLYDSKFNHSFHKNRKFNNEGSKKRNFKRRPYTESISDIID
ncbi:required for respiratory growth protein 9, mitochondrial [[Candida] railenensis]|uniref:Required for respiratory growth protein 9, mitochondrial n=1 Tax=[Candida] railenensis TaxID=45579 RepID=A0A9P0QKY4_9ASCO|nr:required for respiratory growth protein 9, mitochondrial [[Candida] railenensis]